MGYIAECIIWISAFIVMIHTLFALNVMGHRCGWIWRAAHISMCVGAFGLVLHPILGGFDIDVRPWPMATVVGGLALYVISKHLRFQAQKRRRAHGQLG